MKRIGIVIGILALVVAGYYGYTTYVAGHAEPTPEPKEVMDVGPEMIWASGTLLPARWASLSFETGGRLRELKVEEGQKVEAGELLALVDASDLEHAVAQARAALALAEAQLAQVKAGARPEEIAAMEAQVRAAEATLAGARAAVSTAEANVEAAQAAVASAEAELARLRAGPRQEAIAVAEAQVQQAATELAFAQNRFDRLSWVGGETAEQVRYQRDAAAAAHNTALAQLKLAKAKATPEEIAIAEAAVASARAQVKQAEAGVEAARAQVASAEAGVAQAKAQLDLLRAGATPEEIAVAGAQVAQAQAALDQAEGALDKARLYAPFAGTVGQVLVREGELVAPGQPVIILGDLTHLRVETTDLRETDVAKVAVGQTVEVTFDALPGEVWRGTVTRIAPMSTVEQGSTNYTAIIELEEVDPRLRWGMTAFVNIEVGQ